MFALRTRYHFKKQAKLSVPLIFGQLSQVAIMFFDTLMVGNYDSVALAAATITNALYFGTIVFIFGLVFGLKPLVAEADAAGESWLCKKYLSNSLIFFSGVAIILYGLYELSVPYLDLLGQDEKVTALIVVYARLLFASGLFQIIALVLMQYLESLSFSKTSMYTNLIGNVANIFFNYLLIFGNWGCPELGITGAGWGTFISKVLMVIFPLFALYYHPALKDYRIGLKDFFVESVYYKKLFSIGLPIGLQMLFESGCFAVAAVMSGWISPTASAAHQIVLTLSVITYMIAMGISQGSTTHVANMMGFKFFSEIKIAGNVAFFFVTAIMLLASAIFLLFRYELPQMFINTNDPLYAEVLATCVILMFMVSIYQIADGTQVVAIGLLRGMQDVTTPTVLTLISYWFIGIPTSYFAGIYFEMGLAGIWLGLVVGLVSSSFFLIIRFYWQCKKFGKILLNDGHLAEL